MQTAQTTAQTTPPAPPPLPPQLAALAASLAGVLAFAVLPAAHQAWPWLPSLDLTAVQSALGVAVSVALWVHSVGTRAALEYVASTLLPRVLAAATPGLEAALAAAAQAAVARQMQLHGQVGPLGEEDVAAVRAARLARAARAPE